MRGHRDLRLVSALAVVLALVCVLVGWEPLQVAAAIPLALILPGYAVVAASFARLDLSFERLALLTLGCSLACLALGALLLHFVPGGITDASWAILLVAVVLAGCGVAAVRRPEPRSPGLGRRRPRTRDLILLGAGGVLCIAAVSFAQMPLSAKKASGFSALWMLPEPKKDPDGVRVGVINAEKQRTGYRLVVSGPLGGRLLERRLRLSPADKRSFAVPITRSPERTIGVSALLYRLSDPNRVYRKVRTWLPPTPGP